MGGGVGVEDAVVREIVIEDSDVADGDVVEVVMEIFARYSKIKTSIIGYCCWLGEGKGEILTCRVGIK